MKKKIVCVCVCVQDINAVSRDTLTVSATDTKKSTMYYRMQYLKKNLENVVIKVTVVFSVNLKKGGD